MERFSLLFAIIFLFFSAPCASNSLMFNDDINVIDLNLDSLVNRIRVCNMDAIINVDFNDERIHVLVKEHTLNEFKSVSYLDNFFYPDKMNSLFLKLIPNYFSFTLICVENRYFNTKFSKYKINFYNSVMVNNSCGENVNCLLGAK